MTNWCEESIMSNETQNILLIKLKQQCLYILFSLEIQLDKFFLQQTHLCACAFQCAFAGAEYWTQGMIHTLQSI